MNPFKTYIVCENKYIFECQDYEIYKDNAYCAYASELQTKEFIEANYIKLDKSELDPKQICIYFDEPYDIMIDPNQYFLEFLRIVDKYDLNAKHVYNKYISWFLLLKHNEMNLWQKYNFILKKEPDMKLIHNVKWSGVYTGSIRHYTFDTMIFDKCLERTKYKEFDRKTYDIVPIYKILNHIGISKNMNEIMDILLSSITYCRDVLRLNLPFNNYQSMYYAMRILDIEERMINRDATINDRFIFTLDEIHKLPSYNDQPIENNPYITILENFRDRSGTLSPYYIQGEQNVVTLEMAKQRIDIYTKGCFKYINWDKTALCGSIIPATCVKSKLEQFLDYESYLAEYYPSISPEYQLSEKLIDDKIYIGNSDLDMIIETKDRHEFDRIVKDHFDNIRRVYPNISLTLYKKGKHTYKYYIRGLHRKIDVFMAHKDTSGNPTIAGTIVNFHLDCVRAWFNGSQIYCCRSFITPAKIGINQYIRWTTNGQKIGNTVIKYWQRGFGIIVDTQGELSIRIILPSGFGKYIEWLDNVKINDRIKLLNVQLNPSANNMYSNDKIMLTDCTLSTKHTFRTIDRNIKIYSKRFPPMMFDYKPIYEK